MAYLFILVLGLVWFLISIGHLFTWFVGYLIVCGMFITYVTDSNNKLDLAILHGMLFIGWPLFLGMALTEQSEIVQNMIRNLK